VDAPDPPHLRRLACCGPSAVRAVPAAAANEHVSLRDLAALGLKRTWSRRWAEGDFAKAAKHFPCGRRVGLRALPGWSWPLPPSPWLAASMPRPPLAGWVSRLPAGWTLHPALLVAGVGSMRRSRALRCAPAAPAPPWRSLRWSTCRGARRRRSASTSCCTCRATAGRVGRRPCCRPPSARRSTPRAPTPTWGSDGGLRPRRDAVGRGRGGAGEWRRRRGHALRPPWSSRPPRATTAAPGHRGVLDAERGGARQASWGPTCRPGCSTTRRAGHRPRGDGALCWTLFVEAEPTLLCAHSAGGGPWSLPIAVAQAGADRSLTGISLAAPAPASSTCPRRTPTWSACPPSPWRGRSGWGQRRRGASFAEHRGGPALRALVRSLVGDLADPQRLVYLGTQGDPRCDDFSLSWPFYSPSWGPSH